MGYVILAEGLEHRRVHRPRHARFRRATAPWCAEYPPERAEPLTGIPADEIRRLARLYASAPRAVLCWTLGITEHHNATDNVYALVNLALLTGHVGRPGSGLAPLRGQNNVQGGGDMGALPDRLPGFQHVADDARRGRFEQAWGVSIPRQARQTPDGDDARHGARRAAQSVRHRREPGAVRRRRAPRRASLRAARLPGGPGHHHDRHRRGWRMWCCLAAPAGWSRPARSPTASAACSSADKSFDPPGEARDDCVILQDLANRLGAAWSYASVGGHLERGPRGRAAHVRRHELCATGSSSRGCSGPARTSRTQAARCCTRDSGSRRRSARAVHALRVRAGRGHDRRQLPVRPDHRADGSSSSIPGVQTRAYPSARRQEELVMIHPDDAASVRDRARRRWSGSGRAAGK